MQAQTIGFLNRVDVLVLVHDDVANALASRCSGLGSDSRHSTASLENSRVVEVRFFRRSEVLRSGPSTGRHRPQLGLDRRRPPEGWPARPGRASCPRSALEGPSLQGRRGREARLFDCCGRKRDAAAPRSGPRTSGTSAPRSCSSSRQKPWMVPTYISARPVTSPKCLTAARERCAPSARRRLVREREAMILRGASLPRLGSRSPATRRATTSVFPDPAQAISCRFPDLCPMALS